MKHHFVTDKGRHRPNNEDSVFVDEVLGLFVVADGMGGHRAGEVASLIAVEQIASHVRSALTPRADPFPVLIDSIRKANDSILRAASMSPQWAGMGTTVVMALFENGRVFVCHVGDSRAYLVRDGAMRLLTKDHTLIEVMIDQGLVPRTEAKHHEARHGLTRALGVLEDLSPDTTQIDWTTDDALLLCSDGLTDALSDEEIFDIMREFTEPDEACLALTQRANDAGGPDNISVIVVR